MQDGKLIIAGFESLGVASQNYKLLFSRKKSQNGIKSPSATASEDSSRNNSSPPPPPEDVDTTTATPKKVSEVVRWPGDYFYDSQDSSCQIFKFFGSERKKNVCTIKTYC